MKKPKKITVVVHFEDNGQDFLSFTVSFDEDYGLGEVLDCQPFQQSIWVGQFVLSGKPVKNGYLRISKSPTDTVTTLKHKITEITAQ